ncbi:hypothetical protein Tco_0858805 [Tanacetum coccineum]|uniref:Uncharacterized protein n=1 Tax=Tanacetum coccineum TaxID=301880 RepID=A0ABQ5BE74_9ASTR
MISSKVEIPNAEEQSRRHALFALSEIHKSGYGLLEVQFLVASKSPLLVPHGALDASYENSLLSPQIPKVGQRNPIEEDDRKRAHF